MLVRDISRINRIVFVGVAFLAGLSTVPARAALFLAGDSNLLNAIDGSGSITLDPGNRRFFLNVLAGGDKALVDTDSSVTSWTALQTYYNSLPGVSATTTSGTITSANFLGGVDLFFIVVPNRSFAAPEISAMQTFLNGGGTLFLIGENNGFPTENANLNTVLAGLSAPMSLQN